MSMFEIGKFYRVTTIDGNAQTHATYRLEDFNHPLIQVWLVGKSIILNTAAQSFVSAELVESDASIAAQDAWHVTAMDDSNAA